MKGWCPTDRPTGQQDRDPMTQKIKASPMGFEPTFSTVTGWRALLAAPRGLGLTLFVFMSWEWIHGNHRVTGYERTRCHVVTPGSAISRSMSVLRLMGMRTPFARRIKANWEIQSTILPPRNNNMTLDGPNHLATNIIQATRLQTSRWSQGSENSPSHRNEISHRSVHVWLNTVRHA